MEGRKERKKWLKMGALVSYRYSKFFAEKAKRKVERESCCLKFGVVVMHGLYWVRLCCGGRYFLTSLFDLTSNRTPLKH